MSRFRPIHNVLVLGSEGFLGRHISSYLRAQGLSVGGLDRATAPDTAQLERRLRNAVAGAPDLVIHAAGVIGSASEMEYEEAHVRSTVHLLDLVESASPMTRVVLLGSAAEIGPSPDGLSPAREREGGNPKSAYGRSKLEQSRVALDRAVSGGLDLLRIRLFNTLGPRQSRLLVAGAMIERLSQAVPGPDSTLDVFDPSSVRDFLDARDVARCVLRLASDLPRDPERPPVHVCSGEGLSIAALAGELLAASEREVKLRWIPGRAEPTRIVGDCSTLRETLGLESIRSFDTMQSLRDMWAARYAQETPK